MYKDEDILIDKIKDFRKRFFLKSLYKGLVLFVILMVSAFITINVLEYYGNFNSIIRSTFFFSFLSIALWGTIKYIAIPTYKFINKEKELDNLKTAELIGQGFPSVKDKLVNYLQLLQNSENNTLAQEALKQKKGELKNVPFLQIIKFEEINKYLKYSVIPIILLLGIFMISPAIFSEGSNRIINYNKTFVLDAPFKFTIKNKNLKTFQNEDFILNVALSGQALPENIYVEYNGRKIKLENIEGDFSHTFKNIQNDLVFNLEASGYSSNNYKLEVIQKPTLSSFNITLDYPSYIGKKSEMLENSGNMTVPEGTLITWDINARQTDTVIFTFGDREIKKIDKSLINSHFKVGKKIITNIPYSVTLLKSGVDKKSETNFNIEVIKDQYPSILSESVSDTILYKEINIGGSIKDDYGFSRLALVYSILDESGKPVSQKLVPIPIDPKNYSQNFYYSWNIDTLKIKPGERITYYLQVWDNDGVNGAKSAKTNVYELKLPNQKTIEEQIQNSVEKTEGQLDNSMSKAMELQKDFEKLQNKIKGKKNLDWQDKKAIEDYIKKHDALKQDIEKLSELNKNLNEKHEKFTEEDLRIAEKAEKLQDLIQNIMDEETKKLWEDLQKLMEEKNKDSEIQDLLNKIDQKDESMEKELDRAMEFYKQLQFDRKLEENIEKLQELADKQKELSDKSNDKNADSKELEKQQEELNKSFDEIKKEMQEMKDINNSLENKHDLKDLDQMQKEAEQKMQEAKEELNQGDKKDANKKQKEASGKMQEMANQMQKMKQSEEQKQNEENMDDLRQILENLIKLSFDQEELMKNLKKVNKSDPKYLQYSQEQLKLRDDAKVIEDSLFALSKRVQEIESFINKEVGNMKNDMDESSKLIKKREPMFASAKQQAAMTSMNNLALMLDDVLRSMQEKDQQQSQDSKSGSGSCKKPGSGKGQGKKKGNKPSPGQMQDQLNQQMQQLINGGKSGTKMSEQLAKMAAQQERIRKALKEMENMRKMGEKGKGSSEKPGETGKEGNQGKNGTSGSGGDADKMLKEMEKIEEEIVNKRINPELIKRQKELTTRLLEFEKSLREREMEEKRESNTGKEFERPIPPSLIKYFSEKNKVTEMIRTVPPNLNPYYKKKVNDFIQNLNP